MIGAFGNLDDGVLDGFAQSAFTNLITVDANATTDGLLHITGSECAEGDCDLMGNGDLGLRLTVGGTPTNDDGTDWEMSYNECTGFDLDIAGTAALTAVVPVSAGTHIVARPSTKCSQSTSKPTY